MKNLYYNWYKREVSKIEKEEADSNKIINRLKDLLDEWDKGFSGGHDAEVIHRAIKGRIREEKEKKKSQISLPTGFSCPLHSGTVKKLYPKLIDKGYIEAEESNLVAVFSNKPLPDNFKPIIWKKTSTRNKTINKKSLIDLLKIADVEDIDITKINSLFYHPQGGTINIKSSNIFNNKGNDTSEFYNELKSFLNTI